MIDWAWSSSLRKTWFFSSSKALSPIPILIGLNLCAFLATGLKSRLSSHGPLLSLTDVTSCFFSSAPIVSLRKRLVLVFIVRLPPTSPLLLPHLPLHRGEDVLLDPEGVVVGGVVRREAGGVWTEDLRPDPRQTNESPEHPLEER